MFTSKSLFALMKLAIRPPRKNHPKDKSNKDQTFRQKEESWIRRSFPPPSLIIRFLKYFPYSWENLLYGELIVRDCLEISTNSQNHCIYRFYHITLLSSLGNKKAWSQSSDFRCFRWKLISFLWRIFENSVSLYQPLIPLKRDQIQYVHPLIQTQGTSYFSQIIKYSN